MKNFFILLAFIVFAASCRKNTTPTPTPNTLQNAVWVSVADTTKRIVFSGSDITYTPENKTYPYTIKGDTISIGYVPIPMTFTVTSDTLTFNNISAGALIKYFKH